MAIHQYDRVYVDGEPLDRRTAIMFREVELESGLVLTVAQGSYQPKTSYSGATHTGGGVLDVFAHPDDPHALTRRFRRKGFAGWHRTPGQGFDEHWHLVDIANDRLSSDAILQRQNYRAGGDGLWPLIPGDDPEPWRPDPIRGWSWEAWVKEKDLAHRISQIQNRIDDLKDRKEHARHDLRRLRHNR